MAGLIEVYRNSINSWDCEMMGHLNVQFYVAKAVDGLSALGQHLGLGPAFVRDQGARMRVREQHIRFLREQRPGAPVTIRAGVLEASARRIRVYEEMQNTGTREVAATFVADVELQDVHTGRPLMLPASARDATQRLRTDLPSYAAPRGLGLTAPRLAPALTDANSNGMVATYLGEVKNAMCDEHGRMTTAACMGVVSDAFPNLLAEAGQTGRPHTGLGGAALEYRFVYRQTPRVGDLIGLRSGIKSIGSKTYVICHWMFDMVSAEAVATAEQVAVMLDLNARKAIAITDEVRVGLQRVLVVGIAI